MALTILPTITEASMGAPKVDNLPDGVVPPAQHYTTAPQLEAIKAAVRDLAIDVGVDVSPSAISIKGRTLHAQSRIVTASGPLLATDDYVLVDTTAGTVTLTAPALALRRVQIIKIAGSNPIWLAPIGAESINGVAAPFMLPGSSGPVSPSAVPAWMAIDTGIARYVWSMGGASAAMSLPLDTISVRGAYCYSHKLRTAYAGPLVRLIRSDAAEQDFYANAAGALDTVALLAWTGALTAKVRTLYDQSGNGLDMTQGTDANRLVAVASPGSIPLSGGHPAMIGGVSLFVARTATFISPTAFGFMSIYHPSSVTSSNTSYHQPQGLYGEEGTYYGASLQTTGVYAGFFGTTTRNVTDAVGHTGIHILRHSYNGAVQSLQCDDRTEVTQSIAESCAPPAETLRFGAGGAGGYIGNLTMLIARDVPLSAAQAAPIYDWAGATFSGLVTP